jgi:ribosomal protein L9
VDYQRISAKHEIDTENPENTETEIEIELADEVTEIKYKAYGSQTEEQIKAALEAIYGGPIDDLWVHLNDNGSIAIATGAEPSVWPEDGP